MRSLSTVSLRSLQRRKGRYVLTAFGIALGVAVLFAVTISTGATQKALDRDINGSVGDADVLIHPSGAYDAVLPKGLLNKVKRTQGVAAVAPALAIRSSVHEVGTPRPTLDRARDDIAFVIGINLVASKKLQTFALADGAFFRPGKDDLIVPSTMADDRHLEVGDKVEVAEPKGLRTFTIVGIMKAEGAALGEQGEVGYTSLATAQRLHGGGAVINDIDVALKPNVDNARWIATSRSTLGEGLTLTDARDAAAGFRAFIQGISNALTLVSTIAVFVGGFLVFLTLSVAVAERTRMYGTMRALGAVPSQVRRVVLLEAALLGFLSALFGLLIGYGLASASVGLTEKLLDLSLPSLGLPVGPAIFAVLLGVIVSVVAAWLPGRRAASLSPVVAMRQGAAEPDKTGRLGVRVGIFAVGVLLALGTKSPPARGLAMLMILLGGVLLVPYVLHPVARFVGALTARFSKGVGKIAVLHLVKERSRSAYTLGLVMVVLAMLMSVGSVNKGMSDTLGDIVERQAGGAVQVGSAGAFDPGVAQQLAAVPGSGTVTPVRFGRTEVVERTNTKQGYDERTQDFDVMVVNPSSYFDVAGFSYVKGDDATTKAALARGGAVLLPDAYARTNSLGVDDTIHLRTAKGLKAFKVVGTYAVVGSGFGVVAGTRDAAAFNADRPNAFLVDTDGGVSPEELRQAIAKRLGAKYQLIMDTSESTKRYAFSQLNGFFSLGYVVLGLAAITGMLGLANTLAVSVLTRTREIGMLRSVGSVRRQVKAMVMVEAATLALVALALAIPLGLILMVTLTRTMGDGVGATVHLVMPWGLLIVLAILTVAVTVLAALLPARTAGRLEPVAALAFD